MHILHINAYLCIFMHVWYIFAYFTYFAYFAYIAYLFILLHIVHIIYIYAYVAYTVYCCILCIFCMFFHILHVYAYYIVSQHAQHAGLLDSEDDEQAEDIPEQPVEVEQPDGAPDQDQAVPAPPAVAAPLHLPDMRTVMQRTGGPDYENMIRELDDHMGPGEHVFPSERCGGGARRLLLKRKASEMSRSLSETFAYLTSTTASIEEAAAILQTFGNVGLVFCSDM